MIFKILAIIVISNRKYGVRAMHSAISVLSGNKSILRKCYHSPVGFLSQNHIAWLPEGGTL
jgi:hypothetical protein